MKGYNKSCSLFYTNIKGFVSIYGEISMIKKQKMCNSRRHFHKIERELVACIIITDPKVTIREMRKELSQEMCILFIVRTGS